MTTLGRADNAGIPLEQEAGVMDETTAGWQPGYDVPPVHQPPGRTRTGGHGFDMAAFVNRVADEFEEANGVVVDRSARETLIAPALPHAADVARALAAGTITIEFLEGCIRSVLGRAWRIDLEGEGADINGAHVQASMDEECPYLFWC